MLSNQVCQYFFKDKCSIILMSLSKITSPASNEDNEIKRLFSYLDSDLGLFIHLINQELNFVISTVFKNSK